MYVYVLHARLKLFICEVLVIPIQRKIIMNCWQPFKGQRPSFFCGTCTLTLNVRCRILGKFSSRLLECTSAELLWRVSVDPDTFYILTLIWNVTAAVHVNRLLPPPFPPIWVIWAHISLKAYILQFVKLTSKSSDVIRKKSRSKAI